MDDVWFVAFEEDSEREALEIPGFDWIAANKWRASEAKRVDAVTTVSTVQSRSQPLWERNPLLQTLTS